MQRRLAPSRVRESARAVAAWVQRRKKWFDHTPVGRALARYSTHHGGILAAGVAYSSLASIASGILLAVTITSLVVVGNDGFREVVVDFVAETVPGIFPTEELPGIVDPDSLAPTAIAGAVGVFALVMLARTATGYLSGLRSALQTMMGRGAGNALVGTLRDVATLVGLGLAVATGATLQVLGSSFARTVAGWMGEDATSQWVVRIPAIAAGLLADILFVALVYVVLGRARARKKVLAGTIVTVAVAIAVLQQASTLIVGGAAKNPVLAPFAAVLVLMVFVDWVSRVLLIGGAWLGVVAQPRTGRSAREDVVVEEDEPISRRRDKITTRRARRRHRD